MLVVTRSPGRRVLIGDHSIVQVVEVSDKQVKLGFITRDEVRRVDNPESVLEAAKVEARMERVQSKSNGKAVLPAVYVGVRSLDDGTLDIRASLREEAVDIAGYLKYQLTDKTTIGPPSHEMLVLRMRSERDAEVVKEMAKAGLVNWRVYEVVENDDATVSVLVVRASKRATNTGDVRYVTLF
jgi:sRNA-binding carbon storage regulator CsrA